MQLSVDIKKQLGDFFLDIQFETGDDVFALLGASGCGKSMTLKCIAGIERPDAGRIVLGDRVLFDSEQKIDLAPQKRRVGYMFQDYALFPNMTVRQNVAVGVAGRTKEIAPEVADLLRRFHVEDLADHYPVQLSGGQKQRVAMARLMGQEPDVILLDEPFSALDSHLKWQLEQEMKETLAEAGRPTIFVSHDRDEVYHLADTVCCVANGHAETIQPMKEFFAAPQTQAAAILSGCKNVAEAEKTGARRLRVPAWGMEVATAQDVADDVRYIGIRAHDFLPSYGEKVGNVSAGHTAPTMGAEGDISGARADALTGFAPQDVTVQEDPFEWTVFFRAVPDADMLQWKTPKKEGEALTIPAAFAIPPEKVLLLR